MGTVLSDIKSKDWQISTAGFGAIAEGLSDIRQCIDLILRTSKGSDSFRPEFGSDIFQYVDLPITEAIPNIKRAILEAVDIWEKRVKVNKIEHVYQDDILYFQITYQLIDQDFIDSLTLSLDGGFVTTSDVNTGLILQAFYPPNPYGRQYSIELIADGESITPPAPDTGFNTINGMFNWVKNNWGYLGTWVQLVDRFVLYMKPDAATTASVSISLLTTQVRFDALLPNLPPGTFFGVDFKPNGSAPTVAYPGNISNMEQLLLWARSNWGEYGTWDILPGTEDMNGDFSALDFSTDFFIGSQGYYLILTSTVLSSGELNVSVI